MRGRCLRVVGPSFGWAPWTRWPSAASDVRIPAPWVQARIYLAMARDGLVLDIFRYVSPSLGTPLVAQVFVGAVGVALALCVPVERLVRFLNIGAAHAQGRSVFRGARVVEACPTSAPERLRVVPGEPPDRPRFGPGSLGMDPLVVSVGSPPDWRRVAACSAAWVNAWRPTFDRTMQVGTPAAAGWESLGGPEGSRYPRSFCSGPPDPHQLGGLTPGHAMVGQLPQVRLVRFDSHVCWSCTSARFRLGTEMAPCVAMRPQSSIGGTLVGGSPGRCRRRRPLLFPGSRGSSDIFLASRGRRRCGSGTDFAFAVRPLSLPHSSNAPKVLAPRHAQRDLSAAMLWALFTSFACRQNLIILNGTDVRSGGEDTGRSLQRFALVGVSQVRRAFAGR